MTFGTITCVLTIFGLIVYTQQQIKDPEFFKKFNEYSDACVKESGVDKNDIDKFWTENHFPSNDQQLKCYFRCLNLKLGVMTEKGEVIDNVLKSVSAQFENQKTDEEIVQECGAIEGSDLCETAFKLMTCVKAAHLD